MQDACLPPTHIFDLLVPLFLLPRSLLKISNLTIFLKKSFSEELKENPSVDIKKHRSCPSPHTLKVLPIKYPSEPGAYSGGHCAMPKPLNYFFSKLN